MEQAKERSRLLQLAYARGDCTSAVASLSTSSSDEAAEEKQLKQKLELLKARLQTELDEKEKLQMMKQKKKRDEEAAAHPTPMDTENAAAAKVGSSFASARACWRNTLSDGVLRWLNARRNIKEFHDLDGYPFSFRLVASVWPSQRLLHLYGGTSQVRHKAEPDL